MKIETNKASGFILNYLVMVAEGHNYEIVDGAILTGRTVWRDFLAYDEEYSPSTDRAQCHEIAEREMLTVGPAKHQGYMAWAWPKRIGYWGDTPLIAAMRCRVASKLGEVIDIPDELLTVFGTA